ASSSLEKQTGPAKKQKVSTDEDMEVDPNLAPQSSSSSLSSPSSSAQKNSSSTPEISTSSPISGLGNAPHNNNTKNYNDHSQFDRPELPNRPEDPPDEDMDETPDPSAPDDISIIQAAIVLSAVKKKDETKNQLLNRLRYYFTDSYPSNFKGVKIIG